MIERGIPSRFVSELVPPAELSVRLRTAIEGSATPRTGTRRRITLLLAAVPGAIATVLLTASHLVHGRPALRVDLSTAPTSELVLVLILVGALALATTLVAVGRGARGLGPPATSLFVVAVLVTPVYAVLTLAIPIESAEEAAAATADLSRWGLRCGAIAAAAGMLVLTSFACALRRSVAAASRLRGAALGAAAGAWSGLTVFLFCPATELGHLLVGHVLPIAAFTLLALVAVPRVLRP
jgi:hypothetical protein